MKESEQSFKGVFLGFIASTIFIIGLIGLEGAIKTTFYPKDKVIEGKPFELNDKIYRCEAVKIIE